MKAAKTSIKSPVKAKVKENSFPVVAIGASAGGLEAITELLKNLPSDTGMSFIYVQHLSPDHKSMLTEILSKTTNMKVQEIDDMDKIKPDNVFIIPYNKGIEVTDGHIKLIPRSDNSKAISIDILFSSLAHAQKERVIGVILSGSASDGTVGMKDIKHEGGLTFAQDNSAKFTSMPQSAIAAGVVDFILSPKEIALELARISKHPFINAIGVQAGEADLIDNNNPDLKIILNHLHKATGVDFSAYKMNTIKRRIIRRMLLYKIKTLKEYAKFLNKKNEEIDILYQDLLINVTSFFRDTDTHKYLKENLFPKLLKRKKTGEPMRIWVPACASGEEACSIAMMLLEIQDSKSAKIPVQIFATDLSAQAIRKARIGIYTKQELENVSPKRIQRFFTKSDGSYRVNKSVRDMCVFAPHNVLKDPPFSRLDFISCRNLFIYLDNAAQKKAVNTFHYALNDDGFLMVGKSETITASAHLFKEISKKYKIFSRKLNSGVRTLPQLSQRPVQQTLAGTGTTPENKTSGRKQAVNPLPGRKGASVDIAIDEVLLTEFMPASVAINHQMEIVQFRGKTDFYLTHPKGKATFNILKMARPEIAFELRNAIVKAIKTNHRVRKSGIEIKINSVVRVVSLEVMPLTIEADEPLLLILFAEQEQVEVFPHSNKKGNSNAAVLERRIKKLEEELATAHADALALSQEQEAFTEELQSANEEVVSSNEELQTVNEELETSKEEIESANEELITTNQELQTRNDLLNESYEYSEAILETFHNPFLILDKNLRVKSANKSFYKTFHVREEDTEGVFLFDLGNNQWNIPQLREMLQDIIPKSKQFHDFEVAHNFPAIGEKVLHLNASRIIQKTLQEELILLAIADVTEQTAAKRKIEERNNELTEARVLAKREADKFREFLESAPDAIVIVNKDGKIQIVNSNAEKLFGYKRADIIGKELELLIPSRYKNILRGYRKNDPEHPKAGLMGDGMELFAQHKDGKRFPVEISLSSLETREGTLIAAAIRDVTRRKLLEKELIDARRLAELSKEKAESAMKAKQQFLANMSHEIRTPMTAIIGFSKIVLKTDLTEKQREYISAIKISSDSLLVLINDILDLAKVDAGKMTFEQAPFEMESELTAMLHLFDLKCEEKNLKLIKEYDSTIPKTLLGDSVRLNQIILNLVSNAIKFTSKGKITVSVRLLNTDADKVTIEFAVSDTGIGLAENIIPTIFENFQQATSSTTRLFGGTGLGLAIVKQLVERQGGTIDVKSKINEGSTFSFILRFQKAKDKTESGSPGIELNSGIKKIKVLVVEDVPLNQMLMKIILDDFGFDRDIAENGKIAIEKLQTDSYDIILMDLQMPEMNGFEATDYIRNKMNSKIPIVALTADVTADDLVQCKAIGMNDHMAKPIDEKLLYNKIVGLVIKP